MALTHYRDGEKRSIRGRLGVKVGDQLMSGPEAPIRSGNALPLARIPIGSTLHNIELTLGRVGQLVRSAGTPAPLLAQEGDYAVERQPSVQLRPVHQRCQATLGQAGYLHTPN